MGQGGSRSERELLKKKSRDYRLPEVRAKDRFTVTDNTSLTTAYEASVDKVLFVIFIVLLAFLRFDSLTVPFTKHILTFLLVT